MAAIETSGLTKFYGDSPGIIDLDLEIRQGEIFGFLGPNGAGKSTTIRTLLNFLIPTRGSGTIFGLDIGRDSVEIRARTGYLPGDLALYDRMTAREFLLYFANLRNIDARTRTEELAERFELDLDRRIKDYSTGNRQKVGLVNAFMHDPELLILDEPTGGLDPLMQQEFQDLLEEVREEGRTVFLSSHILPEVERLADRVGIVRDQRLVTVDSVEAFKGLSKATVTIRFASMPDPAMFASLASVTEVETRNGGDTLVLTVEGTVDAVLKTAAAQEVLSISSRAGELEDVFLSYYAHSDAS
ncbi:MAG: ABC transporter ATP-binding protein [Acidimicrobiia bacterium]|nr:MAG: ABC transporter ATP-binding protein [Acidimicrobiia bacterium]